MNALEREREERKKLEARMNGPHNRIVHIAFPFRVEIMACFFELV